MRRPFVLDGRDATSLQISASIGIATADDRSTSGDLLRNADFALYQAKAAGRDRSATYTPDLIDDEPLTLDTKADTR
jgi:PleD family two-component response regulator